MAYAVPLREDGSAFNDLRKRWLPYYGDSLREQRLRMVHDACGLTIERIHFAIDRGAHRVYPIAYNKWIRAQVVEWLGLPDLYGQLPRVLEVSHLRRGELIEKTEHLGDCRPRGRVHFDDNAGDGAVHNPDGRKRQGDAN